MSKCWDCRKEIADDLFRCEDCLKMIRIESQRRRRPLTEWEEKKLSFYRDERKWHDDISRRSIVFKNGKKYQVYKDRNGNIKGQIPEQPRHLLPKPQEWQPSYMSNRERVDR